MNFFSIDRVNVLIMNWNKKLIRYHIEKKDFEYFNDCKGILGECVSKGIIIQTTDPFNDPMHDPRIDIKTHLPLHTMALKNGMNETFGAIQFIRVKIIMEDKKDEEFISYILFHYEKLISYCYDHVLNYESELV